MKKSSSSTSSPSEIRSEAKAREHEMKVITERISMTERNFTTLMKDFAAFNVALDGLREKGNKLSVSVDSYSEEEYPSVKMSLAAVAENLATIQDTCTGQVNFIQGGVVMPLSLYSTNCKIVRDYVKGLTTARDKELLKQKALDKVKTKDPHNKGKISQAEQMLQKAAVDSNRCRQTLEEQMISFEKKKIEDIKKIFGNFFHAQMLFHAKALEIYTQACSNLGLIEEDQDLEAFQNALHVASIPSQLDATKAGSQTSLNRFSSQGSLGGSQLSLNRTGQSFQSRGTEDEDSDFG